MAVRDLSYQYVSQSFNRLVQIDPNDGKTALSGTGSAIHGFSVSGSIETTSNLVFNSVVTQSIFYESENERLAIKKETTASFINTVEYGGVDPTDPPNIGNSTGYGTIYINTGSNDVFMWI